MPVFNTRTEARAMFLWSRGARGWFQGARSYYWPGCACLLVSSCSNECCYWSPLYQFRRYACRDIAWKQWHWGWTHQREGPGNPSALSSLKSCTDKQRLCHFSRSIAIRRSFEWDFCCQYLLLGFFLLSHPVLGPAAWWRNTLFVSTVFCRPNTLNCRWW